MDENHPKTFQTYSLQRNISKYKYLNEADKYRTNSIKQFTPFFLFTYFEYDNYDK